MSFEWISAQPTGFEWISESALGQLPEDQPAPANGTKRSLSVIEKVVIAGFIVNTAGLLWNVWRAYQYDHQRSAGA